MAHIHFGGVVWLDPKPPASLESIVAVERQVGAVLPSDYRELLLAANGGDLRYNLRLSPNTVRTDEAAFGDWFHAGEPNGTSPGTLLGELRCSMPPTFVTNSRHFVCQSRERAVRMTRCCSISRRRHTEPFALG